MTNSLGSLVALQQEREILRTLLSLAQEQQHCLIAGEPGSLNDIVASQATLLQQLSQVMKRSLSPADISQHSEQQCLRVEIDNLAGAIQRQATINRKLADEALHYVSFTINAITGYDSSPAYSSEGTCGTRRAFSLVNKTA
jgi:hypothetical protein